MPRFGMIGAPVAFALASLAATLIGLGCMKRSTRTLLGARAAIGIVLAALIAGLVIRACTPARAPDWLLLAAYAMLYGVLLFALARAQIRRALSAFARTGGAPANELDDDV